MALNDQTKDKIHSLFAEILEILDAMNYECNEYDALDINEEALRFVEWLKKKTELRYGSVIEEGKYEETKDVLDFPVIYSGIYWAYLGRNIGDEMNKHRPVLVLRAAKKSNVCTVVPLTKERLKDDFWYHVDLEEYNNTAVVEQLRVISKRRLEKPMRINGKIATASKEDLKNIYEQIKNYYATPKQNPKKK
ncbi:MAG: type II toxin-antitoxin system PemK/MazF family toxin [Bacillales bacterium]|nr:type II toxin-antitoxin system PemK/MazF family toxin [Bacillales bacterium]